MKKPKENRTYLIHLDVNEGHNWAIFTRKPKGEGASFYCLLPNEKTAMEVARQYASESVGRGELDFTYYVMQITHKVGMEDMKPVDRKVP
jgi:hypothetical protein